MFRIIEQEFSVPYHYPIVFTTNVFSYHNPCLRDILKIAGPGPHRVLVVIDSGLAACQSDLSERVASYFIMHEDCMRLAGEIIYVPGGEAVKQHPGLIEQLYRAIDARAICRHSFVLAIGGGAVIDAVGLAAATAHRGVRLIRMPSTVLAQNDAALGVKNAVNLGSKKNFIGTFSPPWAVVCDYEMLRSLPETHRRSGMAEAIKIALIRDAEFFSELRSNRYALAAFEDGAVRRAIERCAELHLMHIARNGDPFEQGSARPLDFGHWLAHALEAVSEGELTHGDAVAIGIAVDSYYSYQFGWVSEEELTCILDLLEVLGFPLDSPYVHQISPNMALEEFRQHLGGALTITLLQGIGRGFEVHEIDASRMRSSLAAVSAWGRRKRGQTVTG